MKVAIIGSRQFTNFQRMVIALEPYQSKITTVISGGARGADSLAELWADEYDIEKDIYPAQWDKHGKGAGYIRNQTMIEECDACIAFWYGKSIGTKHSIELCRKNGKPLKIINV